MGGAVVVLPLLGAELSGENLRPFFRFPPPLEIPSDYLRFSWAAAAAVVALLAALAWPWIRRARPRTPAGHAAAPAAPSRRLPAWGWIALAWTGAWWLLAWTRWEWFAAGQAFTFFPLWLGFIGAVNALVVRRTGSCFPCRHPGRWTALFGASAICWWGFEWLNRFVRNWHYLNVEDFGPVAYAIHATFCFSTVLPAVLAVAEWIGTHERWTEATARGPAWPWLASRRAAAALAAFGMLSLAGTGVWPAALYPALWISPLALQLALPVLRRQPGLAGEIARGDWRRAATWMVAALVCGFFWELWNWHSLAKWIYTVPGVDRWHVFEMPLLGYAGYLPFGLECLLVCELVVASEHLPPRRPEPRKATRSA